MTVKIDATRPFYAVVGAGDLAVEFARTFTTEAQARFAKLDLEPQALREQAVTVVSARIDELTEDAKDARTQAETFAKEARTQVESYLNETVAEVNETYGELATRGRDLVARIRRQQATQDAKAGVKSTKTKAKTAKTQTTKSAKSTASTAKKAAKSTGESAKKTAGTAKTSAKSTATAAKKTAENTSKAVADGADKVGD